MTRPLKPLDEVIADLSGGSVDLACVLCDIRDHARKIDQRCRPAELLRKLATGSGGSPWLTPQEFLVLVKHCGKLTPLLAVLLAVPMGLLKLHVLRKACQNEGLGLNVVEVVRQVSEWRTQFNPSWELAPVLATYHW